MSKHTSSASLLVLIAMLLASDNFVLIVYAQPSCVHSYFRSKNYDDAVEMYSKAIYFCPTDDEHTEQMVSMVEIRITIA
jgi:hypothetical protein